MRPCPRARLAPLAPLAALSVALPATAAAQAAWTPTPAAATADGELVAAYQRMLDALVRRDTLALRRVLAPGYVFTRGTTGEVAGVAERLHLVATERGSTNVLRVDGCRTQLHGDAAVAACRVAERGLTAAGGVFQGTVASTVVFVRDVATREWRIAATHTSPTPGYRVP